MTPNPDIRASDADRDRVAATLREHCAQGRITMDELDERLEAAYTAKTLGQLLEITSDLPEEDLYERPVPAAQRAPKGVVPVRGAGGGMDLYRSGTRALWGTWAVVSGINFTVWMIIALTGEIVYPWWLWVAGPWGAVLAAITLLGASRRRE
ncbi:DUF1707 SHOCT-like domain-containing protein [Actinomadura rugatobispora]|uniref:DUF1707 domain-containing protein n=1 Tax=Actinomadura rugatobispora TaxID=1994 RepID=A0ABW1A3R5_9ACTN|nr:DUF1707 domain-containing protein [Actinomadura rugatobispora]